MSGVFIYWDNSNIFHETQRLAEGRVEGPAARYRVRVNFDNMCAWRVSTGRWKRRLLLVPCRRKCANCGTVWKEEV